MSNEPGDEQPEETYTFSDTDLELVHELRYARRERKIFEEREAKLRKELMEKLGTATAGMTASGDVAVSIKRTTRRNISGTKLEALYPEIYNEVMSESEVTTLNLP